MSVRRLYSEQPASFEFSQENLEWCKRVIGRYPKGRQASAVIPLLTRAQEQEGWVTQPAIEYVADMLSMPYIRVLEVATFYTQFQLQPVGKKAHIQVCGTTPCMLRGAEDLIRVCKNRIAAQPFTLSDNGDFSWEEVECAGACVNAPMVQIFKDTYEDLTPELLEGLIADLEAGRAITAGSQQHGRVHAAPASGQVTLTDPALYDGSVVKYGLGADITEAPSEEDVPSDKDKGETKEETVKKAVAASKPEGQAKMPETSAPAVGASPQLLDGPKDGAADNLKEISGIGPKIEEKLNGLGIYHFSQIASWDEENCAFVDGHLSFRGRIEREGWVEQAKRLAAGEETEFSKRVAAGKVDSSKSEGDS